MNTNSQVGLYLSILITIMAFGIGFPSLIFTRPVWLRRIRERYSAFHGTHLLIVLDLVVIAVILLGYLFIPTEFYQHEQKLGLNNFIGRSFLTFLFLAVISIAALNRFHNARANSSWRIIGATLVLVLAASGLFGFLWDAFGVLLMISFETISKGHANFCKPCIYLANNPDEVSNVLILVSFVGAGVLWLRLYLYNVHSILERLSHITQCRFQIGNKLYVCWSFWLLKCVRRDLFPPIFVPPDKKEERDYENIASSIVDMGILGANARDQGEKIAVLRALNTIIDNLIAKIQERRAELDSHEEEHQWKKTVLRTLNDVRIWLITRKKIQARPNIVRHTNALLGSDMRLFVSDVCNAIDDTVTNNSSMSGQEGYRRALEALDKLLRITQDNDNLYEEHNRIAYNVIEHGESLLRFSSLTNEVRYMKFLFSILQNVQTNTIRDEALFRFGLLATKENKIDLQLMTLQQLKNTSDANFYVGLLARIAEQGGSAREWVLPQISTVDSDNIEKAKHFFTEQMGDFVTADAIADLAKSLNAGDSIGAVKGAL